MTPDALRGMRLMVKEANMVSTLGRYARPIIMRSSALPGAAIGAGMGAATGVAAEAVSGGDNYGAAALQGAAGGALLGAGTGASVGKVRNIALSTGKRGKELASEVVGRTGKAVKDFGARQRHGITGYVPKGGPESIGLRGGREKTLYNEAKALREARAKTIMDPRKKQKYLSASSQELKDLKQRGEAATEAYDAGLTSLPGMVKGLKDPKRMGKALLGNAKAQGVSGLLALPAGFTALDMATGASPGEAVGSGVGTTAGMTVSHAMPVIPQMAVWEAFDRGGRAVGRLVGKKRKTPQVSPPAPPMAQPRLSEEGAS